MSSPRMRGTRVRGSASWKGLYFLNVRRVIASRPAPRNTVANARRLRRNLSPPEALLWSRLRARVPEMPIFRRQHPIGPYVLDFYCAKARLAIEIDGMSHDVADRPQRDIHRDAWLEAEGLTVMRVAARDVMRCIDEIVDGIVRTAAAKLEAAPSTALRAVPLPRVAGEDNGE